MAEENNEDDSWLYGSSNENQENKDEQPQLDAKTITDNSENETTQDVGGNDEYPDDQHVCFHSTHFKNQFHLKHSNEIHCPFTGIQSR